MKNHRTLFFVISLLYSGSTAADSCVTSGVSLYAKEFTLVSSGNCLVLSCSIEPSKKNVIMALSSCHRVEKDNELCGWGEAGPVTDAKIKKLNEDIYAVEIRKCGI